MDMKAKYLLRTTLLVSTIIFLSSVGWGQEVLVAWETNGLSGVTDDGWQSTTTSANVNPSELHRGSGVNASSLSNGFASTNWTEVDFSSAVSAEDYIQFEISVQVGYELSLSSLDVNLRRTSTGPTDYQWQYSIDGFSSLVNNLSGSFTYDGTESNGLGQPTISLSSISDLQNLDHSTVVTFRLYAWGASSTAGSLAIGMLSGDDLVIRGDVSYAGVSPTIYATPISLANLTYIEEAGPSPEKTFTVSGTNLEGDITIVAPVSYEISEVSGSGFVSSITLSETEGEVAETDIYVRLKAGLSVGDYNEDITISSLNASDKVVSLSGTVTPSSFQVTFSKLGEGDITAKVDDVEITSGSSVDIGSEIVFTATPADGYQVKQWTLNSQVVADNTSNALVVPSIDADVTVTVEFEPIEPDTYKVTYSVVGSDGTLTATADDNPVSAGDDIVAGSTIVFTASPEVGYTIKGWTVNGDPLTEFTDDIYTIPNLAADVVVTVEFEPIVPETYTVTFSVVGSNGSLAATANGEGITSGASVEEGSLVVFTASPSAEHRVKEWTINGEVVTDNTSNELSIASLDGDVSVTVSFEKVIPQIYTVTFSVVEVNGETNGTLTATANASNISSGDSVEEGSVVEFVATPNEGFLVKVWVVNGDPLSEFTDNTYTINGLSDDVVVTVEFVEEEEEKYSVTFSVKAGLGNLVVSADGLDIVSGQEVAVGSTVVFSADPAPHYRVKEWVHNNEVVVGITSNEYTIPSLDENATVTVEFEEVIPEMYTVSFSVVEVDGHANGTLAATVNTHSIASGVQVEEGSTIVFTASPSDGYRVKEWSVNDDPLADYTDNTYTLTGLGANTTVTVQFEVITSVPSLALGGVRVYPNPFTSTISIANVESVSRVIITDIIGKQVMAVKLNGDTHINTSSLRSGVYLVILEDSNGQRVVRRLVKR